MTNEEKQKYIDAISTKMRSIAEECDENLQFEYDVYKLALAALTAQPVKLPHEWVHIRFTDRSKSQRMKCQIAWSDSLNSVIYDEEGAPLLISNGAYEVQE